MTANSAAANMADGWQDQTVLSFWKAVNWENMPIAVAAVTQQQDGSPALNVVTTLSMELPVQKYFAAIPWSGVGEIGAVPQATTDNIGSPEDRSDTLDDFLDDISQFF
ncbi:hypothetical protein [Thalassoporum mexicanum]|uniref:hypothetical protein n=1 Tax=Thalassoporum mexicanum TaxID=3457544 RepID=UPI0002EF259A|nr:hypothetical protein [Pseudanabaena sp. PCC 7367]